MASSLYKGIIPMQIFFSSMTFLKYCLIQNKWFNACCFAFVLICFPGAKKWLKSWQILKYFCRGYIDVTFGTL